MRLVEESSKNNNMLISMTELFLTVTAQITVINQTA